MQEEKLYNKYLYGKHWNNHPIVYAQSFAEFLRKNNFTGTIVDIGCGNGRDINFFTNYGFDCFGIDCLEDEIVFAKQRFPKLNFETQNVEKLEFDDNSVDAFFMINVIHYVDKKKALSEILRTLKPGGYFFIHFNVEIKDNCGNIDYKHDEKDIMNLVSNFDVIHKKVFERVDIEPVKHTHKIIELILQKRKGDLR